jgi:hypothetical protein
MKKANRKLARKAKSVAKKQRRVKKVTRVEFNWMNPWAWLKQKVA